MDIASSDGNDAVRLGDTASRYAEILADVLDLPSVDVDAHWFSDLGADSLVMAKFCARVRRHSDLPPVTMRDIYATSSARDLAAAVGGVDGVDGVGGPRGDTEHPGAPSVVGALAVDENEHRAGTAQYVFCGALQLGFFLLYVAAVSTFGAAGYDWITGATSAWGYYVRAVVMGAVAFVGMSATPIVAKWVLVGRWRPGRIPVWSLRYFRFWAVRILIRTNPLVLLAVGSPLYNFYLRALGAKIGRGAVVLTRNIPIVTDLLTIGDDTVVRKDVVLLGYRATDGVVETGPVTIGRRALISEATVVDIDSEMGDDTQLGHQSSLHTGQRVPDGEQWAGSPASRTESDFALPATPVDIGRRRARYVTAQMFSLLFLYLPLFVGGADVLLSMIPDFELNPAAASPASPFFYLEALEISALWFAGVFVGGLVVVAVVPRLLAPLVRPGKTYPLYGIHYTAARTIARLTTVKYYLFLFGDSSYVLNYLRWIGYRLHHVAQTGSNFGTAVKQENPFATSVGSGTMVADGLSVMNAEYTSTSFRISPVRLGSNSFLGNRIAFPPSGRTGDDCLLATKVMVPVDGPLRTGVGLLGSPAFEIPRTVERDHRFDHWTEGAELHRRLQAKNRHNRTSMVLTLLARWFYFFGVTVLTTLTALALPRLGVLAFLGQALAFLIFTTVWFVVLERAGAGFRRLRPRFCSIYHPDFWRHERYWKFVVPDWDRALGGTPFKNLVSRMLGVDIGRRVFDDGCSLTERTLVTIGDDVTLNGHSVIQCHSQEDGTFKSDRVRLGDRSTIGLGAFVHYGTVLGADARLEPDSFLMKGEEVPDGSEWGGNPAVHLTAGPNRVGRQDHVRDRSNGHVVAFVAPTVDVANVGVANAGGENGGFENVGVANADRDDSSEVAARAFWAGVLARGGVTSVPPWSPPGTAAEIADLTVDLGPFLRAGLDQIEHVSRRTLVLAAHVAVLATVTRADEVCTRFRTDPLETPVPFVAATAVDTWRELLVAVARTEQAIGEHGGPPAPESMETVAEVGPVTNAMFVGENASSMSLPPSVAVAVGCAGDGNALTLRYRTEHLSSEAAARFAGYHLRALELMTADLDAAWTANTLLSDTELLVQRTGMWFRRVEVPELPVHRQFADRARRHPHAVAAVSGTTEWTYRRLQAAANRVAHTLVEGHVHPGDVVAVATERTLGWLATVLAVFDVGAVYLPIEPHFPTERIETTLRRAECTIVAVEGSGSTSVRDASARANATVIDLEDPLGRFTKGEEIHWAGRSSGAPVTLDSPAYIYFTSGSTGQPKGAVCAHSGMVNHIAAKIDDLSIGDGAVVAQIAPQCFDISLWQLVAGPLVGGRTVLIPGDVLLDVARFVDCVVDAEVSVLQVVPSYLDVVLAYLESSPRELPHLGCVSVTGEAVKKDLTERFFATLPTVALVNAYGLTETSDDTNHEVMHSVPERDRVPLGRPIGNTRIYVLNDELEPVPLGSHGEIVFSGVCVGLGYVNDPERTAAVFLEDPFHAGERLYRSGDLGRWLPEGKLEFLGRRDTQVKVRGFRIEIGEIDNALLEVPGVRDGAVVVAESADGGDHLVAFYTSTEPIAVRTIRDHIAALLPHYMVPSVWHHCETLPLTANSKIDRAALTRRATATLTQSVTPEVAAAASTSPAERRLAEVWARVLGVEADAIAPTDSFALHGGTSLSAVKLVIALDHSVGIEDVRSAPTLAELARLLPSTSPSPRDTGVVHANGVARTDTADVTGPPR